MPDQQRLLFRRRPHSVNDRRGLGQAYGHQSESAGVPCPSLRCSTLRQGRPEISSTSSTSAFSVRTRISSRTRSANPRCGPRRRRWRRGLPLASGSTRSAPAQLLRSVYQSAEDFEHESRSTVLGHGTTPEEIANAVSFILNSPAMTGQMIALDGGQHLLWQTPDIRVT